MFAYRLCRKKYGDPLSGEGAAIAGGRWNSKGTALLYCAANRSLAMAEVAVHLTLATLPGDFQMAELFIPDNLPCIELDTELLPEDWNVFPHSVSTQSIGDDFVRANQALCIRVPSAVTRGDFNLLINPRHRDFKRVKVQSREDFPFDKRIFRQA